jgi:hypothetical protein
MGRVSFRWRAAGCREPLVVGVADSLLEVLERFTLAATDLQIRRKLEGLAAPALGLISPQRPGGHTPGLLAPAQPVTECRVPIGAGRGEFVVFELGQLALGPSEHDDVGGLGELLTGPPENGERYVEVSRATSRARGAFFALRYNSRRYAKAGS